ncbi:MAG: Uma2 family endonuclease [Roseiflexaceae bacterium]
MAIETAPQRPKYDLFRRDRPGWIPEWVGDDWDPNPYAYQTDEELMPAGRFHNMYLQILAEMLSPLLERLKLILAIDVFLFYRDWEGRKQRVAPDALIAAAMDLDDQQKGGSYNLDDEPLPRCVIEVTSPKSVLADHDGKRLFYAWLGIHEYLLLDIVHPEDPEHLRDQIDVYLWRLTDGVPAAVPPDTEGFVLLESIGVRLRADGRQLVFQVAETGEMLHTVIELTTLLADAEQRAESSDQARTAAEQRATDAEAELARLREELARLRGETGN